ncbi:hypothetical protein HBO22_28690 [Pseudomonas gessardii]|nr:hypothetical protein [Pseudomonas gessardii]
MVLARNFVDVFEIHVPIISTTMVSVVGVAVLLLSSRGSTQRPYCKGAVRDAIAARNPPTAQGRAYPGRP